MSIVLPNRHPVSEGGLVMEILTWGLPIFVALALFALSYAMLPAATRKQDFWMAGVWFGVGALVLLLRFIYWGLTDQRTPTLRVVVCLAAFVILTVVTVDTFRSIHDKYDRWVKSNLQPLHTEKTLSEQTTADDDHDYKLTSEKMFDWELIPDPPPERIIANVTPEYLTSFFRDHITIQANKLVEPFIEKWMTASGFVSNVTEHGGYTLVTLDTVERVNPTTLENEVARTCQIRIEASSFYRTIRDRFRILRRGEKLALFGQIADVSAYSLTLTSCEIVETEKV